MIGDDKMRELFMKTPRLGFSKWKDADLNLAARLWGDREVARFLCAAGEFTEQEILKRLKTEIQNDALFHIQYWPLFELSTGNFIGCCGLRPFQSETQAYEIGFHLCKECWGMGYAYEAANAVIAYNFNVLKADKLYAGHHPNNGASRKLLMKLGFQYVGDEYYEPTRLYHPSYILKRPSLQT